MIPKIERPRVRIRRNIMQLAVHMAKQKTIVVEGGRGVGKSTVIGDKIEQVVHDMPGGTSFMQSATYQQALTRTLPSTIQSLTSLGYIKDWHYFVGRKPPAKWRWPDPYEPPLDYTRAITFYNGACIALLSQDVSSRGINTVAGFGDEFALLDPIKFQSETLATIRGQKNRFGNCRLYRSQTYTSSIPRTQEGKFMYKYEEEARLNPEKILYVRASSHINKENLPADWFDDQKRIMTPYEYAIEIDNKRPKAMAGGFYPLFSERMHTYTAYNNDYLQGLVDNNGYSIATFEHLDCRQDADWLPTLPLDIALDYGKFNCIVTAQEAMRNCRFISAFSVQSPELTEDLVNKWCDYYEYHQNKTVHYWYDQTAMGRDGRAPRTYAEIVTDTLRARGWTVIDEYFGKAPSHVDKYNFWGIAMRNNDSSLPIFSWNKFNCKYLIESINNAGAKDGANGIEKIKTDEKKDNVDQRFTTHFSDACDMLAYFKYAAQLSAATGIWMPSIVL